MQESSTATTNYITKSFQLKYLVFEIPIVIFLGFLTLYKYFGTWYVILTEGVSGYPEMLEPSEVG